MSNLELRGIAAGYRGHLILENLDFTVPAGARMALVGANGSGKSTLLEVIVGGLRPASGTVGLAGQPLAYDRKSLRAHHRKVQLVMQDPDDQLLSADVFQDVSFGPLNLGLDDAQVRARVTDALQLMGIEHLAERATHQLSYGERKRVVTAGAVALRPDVLLLDEPTAGMDCVGTSGMFEALARLHERGTSIVLATHDADLALAWADQVAVLVDGRVSQLDPVAAFSDAGLLRSAHLPQPVVLQAAASLGLPKTPRNVSELTKTLQEVLNEARI